MTLIFVALRRNLQQSSATRIRNSSGLRLILHVQYPIDRSSTPSTKCVEAHNLLVKYPHVTLIFVVNAANPDARREPLLVGFATFAQEKITVLYLDLDEEDEMQDERNKRFERSGWSQARQSTLSTTRCTRCTLLADRQQRHIVIVRGDGPAIKVPHAIDVDNVPTNDD